MQTSNRAATHVIESAGEDRRIEVAIDGPERVTLRYSTWTDGLGWCCQKTMHVDAEQLDELHRALTVARHRLNHKRAEEGLISEPARVIQLPTLG